MTKSFILAVLAVSVLLSGCAAPPATPVVPADAGVLLANALTLLDKKGFRIDQPVDVYLVGFEAGTAEKLSQALHPEEVYGAASDAIINFPPSPEGTLGGPLLPLPAIPRAIYRVSALPDAFAHDLFGHVLATKMAGDTFDANAAEVFLAENLPKQGHAWDPDRPAFVILHANGQLPEGHAWRYSYPSGYLEPVRAFGERHPFVVYDVSAKPDPYVTTNSMSPEAIFFRTVFGDNPTKTYNFPLKAGGDETVARLAELTVDATHYRLLQPALYPISTKPCHHVTMVMGVHSTSLTELAHIGKSARDLVNVPVLKSAFTNLTDDDVTVDLKVLALPQDDPPLDALMRAAGNGALIVFPFLDAMRWYLDQHWETYVTKKAHCEEYLSVVLFGDLATKADFGGIGTYDVTADRRISFSVWPELNRLRATYEGPARDVLRTGNPTEDPWNTLNVLVAHEVGHLFGQHHPQNVQNAEGDSPQIDTFQSVWSVMSYETNWRVTDFGKIDANNWQRNRAGYAVQQAQLAGLTKGPEFSKAVGALNAYRWADAYAALEGVIPPGAGSASFHAGESHRHDERLSLFQG